MKRAGNVRDMEARAMLPVPSSRGWRRTSSTLRGNSGSSSRKSRPLWASETSPGPDRERQGGASDAACAVFEGLAEDFEHVAGEFGQFVEEEQAVVGERDFAGARGDPPAHQGNRNKPGGRGAVGGAWNR